MADIAFPHLFAPGRVGPIQVPNRIVFMAHGAGFVEELLSPGGPGFWGGIYADYLGERARGGAGLVITEPVFIHRSTAYSLESRVPGFDERVVSSYRRVTEAVHAHGARIFVQMQHASGQNIGIDSGLLYDKAPPLAPTAATAVGYRANYTSSKTMELDEIDDVVASYGEAARLARQGGFDGIELHLAHGYSLLHTFLSPFYNERTDDYGGSVENRMRIVIRVLEEIRAQTSGTMAQGVRLVAEDFVDGGLSQEDVIDVARRLEASGLVDFIDVSVHGYFGPTVIPTLYEPQGSFVALTRPIKEALARTPVFVTGRIVEPEMGEALVDDGVADFVGMTRQLLADPETPAKAREGNVDAIRRCVGVLQCRSASGPLQCIHNPVVGKERSWGIGTLARASEARRVVIVGGGPAGMEAARVAHLRGHDVHLYERDARLGGQINTASLLPGRGEMRELIRWPSHQLAELGVRITLNADVDASMVGDLDADAIVLATGSTPVRTGRQGYTRRPIPGHELEFVVTADDVVAERVTPGNRVVVYDTEAFVRGPGVAELLAAQGRDVRLVTPDFHPGALLWRDMLVSLLPRLVKSGVRFVTSTRLVRIVPTGIVLRDQLSQRERAFEDVDTVVLATGNEADDRLYHALKGSHPNLYRIGDCVAPGRADRAVYDGHRLGREL